MFGNRKIKSFGGKDIDELYIRADEFRHDLSEMQRGVQVDATIPEILRRRYEYDFAKNYTQEPGYYRNMDSLKIIERSPIGKIPIRDLEKEDIERFLISIVKYSNSVIGKTFGQLKLAYREAISSEIITKNLMDNKDIRRPKSKKRSRKVSAFTREEQQIFLDVMRKHRVPKNRNDYRKQLLIELYTGMRMGEINALRPEDIDIVPYGQGQWNGTIISKLFIGVHYEMLVQSEDGKIEWLLQNYDQHDVGEKIGMKVDPENIQIMHKPKSEAESAIELDI